MYLYRSSIPLLTLGTNNGTIEMKKGNMNNETIRQQRQERRNRYVESLKQQAERLQKIADQKTAEMKSYHGDIAFFTQPATPSSSFGRRREKIYRRYDDGMRLSIIADEVKQKAEWIEKTPVKVKGDAETKRQQERDNADKIFKVGSRIYDWCFREGTILKVNKKTYTIKFDSGSTFTRDKSYLKI